MGVRNNDGVCELIRADEISLCGFKFVSSLLQQCDDDDDKKVLHKYQILVFYIALLSPVLTLKTAMTLMMTTIMTQQMMRVMTIVMKMTMMTRCMRKGIVFHH